MIRELTLVCLLLFPGVGLAQSSPKVADDVPKEWVIDYPEVNRVAPPTKNAYFDAASTILKRGSRTYRTQINGGYGRVGGNENIKIIHVGVDVGLHRVGEPVYAVANGVVRTSMGPTPPKGKRSSKRSKAASPPSMGMPWGNFISIEHRFPDGKFYTTVYGHLDSNRLAKAGDIVKAGQMLGKIGKQDPNINGGYVPHLHFGIRRGRMAEPGEALSYMPIEGKYYALIIKDVGKEFTTLELDRDNEIEVPPGVQVPPGYAADDMQDGVRQIPSKMLWRMSRPKFAMVGHTNDPEPWLDPLPFLRGHGATTRPARFHRARKPKPKAADKSK